MCRILLTLLLGDSVFLFYYFIRKPDTAVRNRPGVKHARRPTRLAGAGLQHHQPVVHVLQDFPVNGLQNVAQLEGVCSQVVHLHEHLVGEGGAT